MPGRRVSCATRFSTAGESTAPIVPVLFGLPGPSPPAISLTGAGNSGPGPPPARGRSYVEFAAGASSHLRRKCDFQATGGRRLQARKAQALEPAHEPAELGLHQALGRVERVV